MKKRRLSITHVTLLAMLIVAVLTWGFSATEYARSVDEFYHVNPLRRSLHIQGDGRFREVTAELGIQRTDGRGQGVDRHAEGQGSRRSPRRRSVAWSHRQGREGGGSGADCRTR